MQYSPKLKMAMEEIKAVAKKYDIAAAVVLSDGAGFSEFLNKVEASWSAAFVEHNAKGEIIRFRIKGKEVGKEKAEQLANDTFNMISHFADVLGRNSLVYYQLLDMLRDYVEVIKNDPGSITGHTEQNN
jgi:hypothetical protein